MARDKLLVLGKKSDALQVNPQSGLGPANGLEHLIVP